MQLTPKRKSEPFQFQHRYDISWILKTKGEQPINCLLTDLIIKILHGAQVGFDQLQVVGLGEIVHGSENNK